MLYIFDDYALHTDRRELFCNSNVVAIEPQVFDILEYLIRHRERVVSRDELIDQIWGGRIVSDSTLSTRINAVRSAIGDSGTGQRLIKTLPRKGVRFVGEVHEQSSLGEEAPARPSEILQSESVDLSSDDDSKPVAIAIDGPLKMLPQANMAPARRRGSPVWRGAATTLLAVGLLCFGVVAWHYFARSMQAERTKANAEASIRLTRIAEQTNMWSRENYKVVRALEQWAVDLDPGNVDALTRLTAAIATGVLNHWSDDVVADLHAADLALQSALRIAPENTAVRGAQCQMLRAMRQYEVAIKTCDELAKAFPKYAFLRKEIGYNRLMLGQLDEALADFLEADRLVPDSRLRWSWNQGMGLIHLMRGQDDKAIELLSRAVLEAPDAGHTAAYLASAYALVGREQEAREMMSHYMRRWPNTSMSNFGPIIGTAAFNAQMERVRKGLRLAGLADG